MDKIILTNMNFYAYHGVLQEEQEKGQNFFIDIEMYIDLKNAGISDNLEDTVDYSAIYDIIKNITEKNKFRLIEKLADNISREILSGYCNILEIIVRVRKPEAPLGGKLDWASVEIKRTRNDI
jgi:7,8-dihydroneopterin aldolase/epimerase/oxygenase